MCFKFFLQRSILCFALAFLGQAQALADSYKTGLDAYQVGQYAHAYEIWNELANNNDVLAQFGLGVMYSEGKGVTRNYSQSAKWYEKASVQGYSPAQYNLGNAYKFGRGVIQSNERAVEYWKMAATQDFAPAQYNLATALYYGRGIKQDRKKAESWYKKSAAGGYKPASERINQFDDTQLENNKTETSVPSKPESKKIIQQSPKLTDFEKKLAADKKWILEQNPGSYTVQILASPISSSINSYLRDNKILDNAKVFTFKKRSRQWYAILYGAYTSKAAVKNADTELSEKLKNGKGWIRKISVIQDILKKDI